MKWGVMTLLLCLAVAIAGCGDSSNSSSAAESDGSIPVESVADASKRGKPEIEVPDEPAPEELVVEDLIKGNGRTAKKGDDITIEYYGARYKNGEEYANSWKVDYPSVFEIGPTETIAGWEVGIQGMKVGGRRELTVPPYLLGFGGVPKGGPSSSEFPPEEGVIFIVDLLGVR